MAGIPWQPIAYIFVQGLLMGLIVGFVVRKLNKAIAAMLGFSVLVINVVWFTRMIGVELPVSQINDLIDSIMRLLPFTLSEVTERFGSLMPVIMSLPFIGGLLMGAWAGFKIA